MKAQCEEEITLATLAQDYSDESKAWALLESKVWPKAPVCPHCQSKRSFGMKSSRKTVNQIRYGVRKCSDCRKTFRATMGTVFENTKIPLSKWMMAAFVLSASKKGLSAHQLHRMIGVTYKTAWFMFHRLRHAMKQGPLSQAMKGVVEIDDAYIGGTPERGKGTSGRGTKHKTPVVALVQRGGDARLQAVAGVSANNLRQVVKDTVDVSANVQTDQWNGYKPLFRDFKHDVVKHSAGEFSRTNADGCHVHVNSAESLFSLIKRGMVGSFHHVSKEHLPRYLDEFEFRWNRRNMTDGERMMELLMCAQGKRLTYRQTVKQAGAQ